MQFLTPRLSAALDKTATRAWAISLLIGAFATGSLSAVAQVCPFDDGNSTLAKEGLVMTRYALGIRGSAMVASTAFAATDAPAVEANIACPNCGLNITDAKDGSNNPTFTPADAAIISRKIAGFKGAELTNGLNLGTGSRNTPAAVQSFLLAGCGVGALPTCLTGQVATFGPTGALQCGSLPSTRTQLGGSSLNQGYDTIIVTPADGRPVVAFLAASSGTIVNLKVLKCGNAACSAGNISTFADITIRSDPFNGIGMAIPSDGLPVISYFDTVNQDLRVVKCGNASCSSGNTATSLDTFGSQGRYSSVAVGADGLPVISYWDASNGHLKIAKCGNAFCTTASSITTADSAPNVGGYTSIAIPTDGRPVVAYNTYANAPSGNGAGVKVLKCANAACTGTPTITPVETVSNSGRYISLAIGADGLPVVAYQFLGTAGFAPKVVKCGNSACSSGNTLTEVDVGTQNGGQFASIAVPADGRPVLVHSDTPLRFVRCGNASCSSGNQATYLVGDNEGGVFTALAIAADGLPIISYYFAPTVGIVKCSNAGCLSP